MTRYGDITSGRVDLARLAERMDGSLATEAMPDPRRNGGPWVDRALPPLPVRRADFNPAGMPR